MGTKKITIADVAKAAGVSEATVSGILNNSSVQSPETSLKVQMVMRELGYTPRRNRLRSENRRNNRIRNVALLVPDVNPEAAKTEMIIKLCEGVERELFEYNCRLSLCWLKPDGSLPDILSGRRKACGVIIRGWLPEDSDKYEENRRALLKFPVVCVFSRTPENYDFVGVDNNECARWAIAQLNKFKPDRVICVTPDYKNEMNEDLTVRISMFKYFLWRNCGMKCEEIACAPDRSFSPLELKPDQKTFIFCIGHDPEVLSCISSFRPESRNLMICAVMTGELPEELRFDFVRTIHIDPYGVGVAAVDMLWRRISRPYEISPRLLISPREFRFVPKE